jgi:predicted HTH transcriptional regulator
MSWMNNLTKAKITRSILAMSNIKDGGVIIVGMQQLPDKKFEPAGISIEDASTFNHDEIADYLKEYADPYVEFTVAPIECGGKRFICIQIKEFDESPVICRKDGVDLQRGRIYYRPRTKNESAPVSSYAEMREILDMAADKAVRKYWSRLPCAGLVLPLPSQEAKARFAEQRKDLP